MRKSFKQMVAIGLAVVTMVSSMTFSVYAEDYLYERDGVVIDESTPYEMGDGVEGFLSTDGKTLVVKGSGVMNSASGVPTGIETLYIESGITSITDAVTFTAQKDTLKNVYFAEGIQTIDSDTSTKGLFLNCSLIESIVLPDSLTSVTGYAFRNCTGLTDVSIGENLTELEGIAFKGTTVNNLTINAKNVTSSLNFNYALDHTESVVITFGNSVETIQELQLATLDAIKCDIETIYISKSVTSIYSGAIISHVNYPQTVDVITNNQVAKEYDWAGNYFTVSFISTADTQNTTLSMTVATDVNTIDITIPVEGTQLAIDSDGNISSEGMVLESNTSFPVTVSVYKVESLAVGDTTNGLEATNMSAPTLVAASKYTEEEWNAMNNLDTRKEIAIALKQVDVNGDGTASTELTEATTDAKKVTTPVELGNLEANSTLVHLESGYGTPSKAAVNIEKDTNYTNYGKAWAGEDELVFRYAITLEIGSDE